MNDKKINIFTKIGCFIIGWNAELLNKCGEASHRMYRKYLSALFIIMTIWGVIGFSFAGNYLSINNILGQLAVALVFMLIVLMIERIIILNVGGNKSAIVFRLGIAICMAFLGATIFDQLIFKDDLEETANRNRKFKIREVVEQRATDYNIEIKKLENDRDSVEKKLNQANSQLSQIPSRISKTEVTNTTTSDNENNPISKSKSTTTTQETNPVYTTKVNEIIGLQKRYDDITTRITALSDSVLRLNQVVTDEYKAKPLGFMEVLNATLEVIGQSPMTIGFYVLLFILLILLELFVVTIRWKEKACDYDMLVEHQLDVKKMQLDAAWKALLEKYVTEQPIE